MATAYRPVPKFNPEFGWESGWEEYDDGLTGLAAIKNQMGGSDDYTGDGYSVSDGKLYRHPPGWPDSGSGAPIPQEVLNAYPLASQAEWTDRYTKKEDGGLFGALDKMIPDTEMGALGLFASLFAGPAFSAMGASPMTAALGKTALSTASSGKFNPLSAAMGLAGPVGNSFGGATAADASWGVNPRGGDMDFGDFDYDYSQPYDFGGGGSGGFMGGNPWGAGTPSPWETLANGPLGGGSVNYGSASDPYGLGWSAPSPTGSAGWDSIFSGGGGLSSGGPWNNFAANPYGSGPANLGTLDMLKRALGIGAGAPAGGGEGGTSALMRLLGGGLSAGLGAFASSQQADTLRELAKSQQEAEKGRYDDLVRREGERFGILRDREDASIGRQQSSLADILRRESERFSTLMGREDAAVGRQRGDIDYARGVTAPSRERFEGSFRPGFSMQDDPGFMDAMNAAGKSAMHGMSVNGNPAGSPNAWHAAQKDVFDRVAYPALKDYRTMNATTGGYSGFGQSGSSVPGIGTNLTQGVSQNVPGIGTSLPGSTAVGETKGSQMGFDTMVGGAAADANVWNALGTGAGDFLNPKQSFSLADLAKLMGGGNNPFKVA